MNILVIGSLNMDLVMEVEKIPKLGETVFGKNFKTVHGGKGANQALAAAKLGANVKMIGAVGKDVFGESLKNNLKNNSVDVSKVENIGLTSGTALITVYQGDNSIILEQGANFKLSAEHINKNEKLFEWADTIIMQLEIPVDVVMTAAKKGKELGKYVILNPAPAQKLPCEIFKYVDALIPNEHEAEQLLGYEITEKTYGNAIDEFKRKGCEQVIITLGEKGCIYNNKDFISVGKIYKTEVVDTTAAGDSFVAAYAMAIGEGKSIEEAIKFASCTSSIVVGREGASTSLPTRKEVEIKLNEK